MRAPKSKEVGEGSARKRIKREEWITTSQAEQSPSQPQSSAQQENVIVQVPSFKTVLMNQTLSNSSRVIFIC